MYTVANFPGLGLFFATSRVHAVLIGLWPGLFTPTVEFSKLIPLRPILRALARSLSLMFRCGV